MTRDGLNATIKEAVQKIADVISGTLRDAQVKSTDITTLFLTGGSTAIPLLKQSVLTMFPAAVAVEGDMFGSVGLGLALDAHRKFGAG